MSGREPRILQFAWNDLAGIADYLMRASGERTAEETTDAILDTIELLGATPFLGPLHHDRVLQQHGYRKLVCGKYVCVYRIVGDIPVVYRVFHGRQNYAWRLT